MDKQQLILGTALKLFVENGFHGTATSKIAIESGVANGTLFNYFRTKEELIVAIYHTALNEMDAFIMERMTSHSISKESFRSLFVATVLWSLENPFHYQYLQQFRHSPYGKMKVSETLNIEENALYVLIQNGINIVLVKPMAVSFIYSLIMAQINGLHYYIISNDFGIEKQTEFISESFDMVWKMIED
jgi:AcrR family transcriptional regulator